MIHTVLTFLQFLGFIALVGLVVGTVAANLLSGSLYNDLTPPRPPHAKLPKHQTFHKE